MRIALLAALLAAAASARASQTDVGTAAAQFLQIGGGARSLGMGEAYTAVADGPDAVYWNPAGLARMTRPEATYALTELPAGINHNFLAVAAPCASPQGTIGLAVTSLTQASLALVNASNQTQGSFSPHSEVYALAYGRSFGASDDSAGTRKYLDDDWNVRRGERPREDESWRGDFSAGLSLKMINENLGTRSATAFAADGGVLYRTSELEGLTLGASLRNVGSKLNFISDPEPLPAEAALSAAYDVRSDSWRFLPALEIDAPYAGNVYGSVGLEATKTITEGMSAAMRLGYTSVSVAGLGVLSGVTAGVGLKIGKFSFDAAFQPMALLGESFRLGLGWKF